METLKVAASFRSGLILLAGIALLATAAAIHAIVLETLLWTVVLCGAGIVLSAWGMYRLRFELRTLLRQRRGEIALYTVGALGVLAALAYFSVRYPLRFDMTEAGMYSLSEQTTTILKRLDKPVRITFFHDPLMRETVELYQLVAAQNDQITLELYDPMVNPAQARLLGVQFAGSAVMRSEDRTLQVHGDKEADIANGILRVAQAARQHVCFLDGHGEADAFSLEAHDHMEGEIGHSHGLGSQYVLHEMHGMAKARHALEAMNYTVEKISLLKGAETLVRCTLLVVAGPKAALLPREVAAVRTYLAQGGNAFFMLDPFVPTGLEPFLREFGVLLENDIVIDETNHFWADVSSPAVTEYNRHQITRDLPLTFFPGARSLAPTKERIAGVSAVPLVNSSSNSYGETTPDRAQFDKERDVPGPTTLMVMVNRRPVSADGAAALRFGPDAKAATGSNSENRTADSGASVVSPALKPSRIAVIGDSDFATNSFFHLLGNGNLFLNTVNYLAAQENLIGIEPRTYDLPRVNLTNRQMKGTFFLSVILIPGLLAVIGTAVWWKQR